MTARHPTIEECEAAGRGPDNYPGKQYDSGGLPDTPEERARFEAYMRGHCWAFGAYNESQRSYPWPGTRMLYGVWRDRGALPTAYGVMEAEQPGYCPVCGPADLGHNKACPYGKHEAATSGVAVLDAESKRHQPPMPSPLGEG